MEKAQRRSSVVMRRALNQAQHRVVQARSAGSHWSGPESAISAPTHPEPGFEALLLPPVARTSIHGSIARPDV